MGLKRTPRYLLLTLGYASLLQVSYLLALALRFEGDVPDRFWTGYLQAAVPFTLLSLLGYLAAGLYHGLWRYASTVTLWQVFKGVSLSAMSLALIGLYTPRVLFPHSVVILVWLWELVLLGGARFSWRVARDRVLTPTPRRARRTLVVGSGTQGVNLVQDMRRGQSGEEQLRPVGYIDDDGRLTGHMIEGIKVRGTIADLPRVIQDQRAEVVIIAQPDLPAKVVREIARFCGEAGVQVKTLPGLSDLKEGRTALSQVRDVRIEDLLGRLPVNINVEEMAEFLRGERVMVTGAGGSIGSELSRQIADFAPAQLQLLDHAENGLYYIITELQANSPRLDVVPLVADIKDADGLNAIFDRYSPTVVFHAAAHKHVPLLEANPREAVLNNVMGTRHLLQASDRTGVRKFVLISTDKAVNPTSVMGASKRVCEMLMQSLSQRSRTRFAAVRFGNVLGSEGSVLPLFHRQLDRGGPLTVTHPEARRYFMTIPEAVKLVIQAGAMGRGGEVFLLDMGEQVRIVDLARQLIRLAGRDEVEIRFTGLRPGEKLFEELHYEGERTRMTRHERIFIWDLDARDYAALLSEVLDLEALARGGEAAEIRAGLHRMVPEYREAPEFPLSAAVEGGRVVELPAVAAPPPAETRDWEDMGRRALSVAGAAVLLALSAPLWVLLLLEAGLRREPSLLVREVRVGRTRRRYDRRSVASRVRIDRRSRERRVVELPGIPFTCLRFRSDLGPVSRFLARRGWDRAPFLLSVLRNDMSLVGPRPELCDDVRRWQDAVPEYPRRFRVSPGIVSLSQVAGCVGDGLDGAIRRTHYDLHYVEHASLLLDVRTLARAAGNALRRRETGVPPPARRVAATVAKGVSR